MSEAKDIRDSGNVFHVKMQARNVTVVGSQEVGRIESGSDPVDLFDKTIPMRYPNPASLCIR